MKKILNISISVFLCLIISIQPVLANALFQVSTVSANAFDIVFAIDNSKDLYNYDYSAGSTWLEAFYGAMEQAPSGSRFGVLSNANETELTDITSAEAALYEIPLYRGTADPVGLLQAAEELLRSGNNQKMIVLSTTMGYNNSALKNQIDELNEAGILIYLAAFEKDEEKAEAIKAEYDNVVVCAAAKELPIRMAELYEYLVTVPQRYSMASANSAAGSYKSSFRAGKHNYSIYQNPNQGGSYLAQLLNMYYLLPTYTEGYGPLAYGACVEASRGNTYRMFQNSFPLGFLDFWNDLAERLLSDTYFSVSSTSGSGLGTVIEEKIRKNLMQRYPVLIEVDGTYHLITSMNNGSYYVDGGGETVSLSGENIRLLDTAMYMQAYLGTPGIMSEMGFSGSKASITLTLPEASDIYYMYGGTEEEEENADGITITTAYEELVVSVKTKFAGVLPRFHRSNLYYSIKLFDDVAPNLWCKEYIFDMVNRGIISGYEENNGLYFKYNNDITIAEFLVMLIKAADITIDTTIEEGETWAYPYLDYAESKGWWPMGYEYQNDPGNGSPVYISFAALKVLDESLPQIDDITRHGYDNPITREFAFYLLWEVATSEECNTPNHLVEYPASDFSSRFSDYNEITGVFKEAVDNLINNNAVTGDGDALNPGAWITRGEMCRLFSYAMFGFDRDNNFKYPEIVNNIKTITLEETGETIKSGTTNEYGEGIYMFTVPSGKTGQYPVYLSENSDGRLKIGVYDSDFIKLDELPEKPGYYRLFGNNQYTINVYGINNADYELIIGARENDDTQFTASNVSYNAGEGPKLGYGNILQFHISKNTSGRGTYYAVPALGWTENNLFEREGGKEIELNGTEASEVTIDNIDLTSGGHQTLYTKINLYASAAKDELLYTIDLGSVQRNNTPMPADLELTKQGGGNFLYVNNPEKIIDNYIIKDRDEQNSNLLYCQEGLTGYNTLYVSHSTFDFNIVQQCYFDVDLYNPSAEPLTITIEEPYMASKNSWGGYETFNDLYLERIYDAHETKTITIPAWGRRLLYRDIMPNEFGKNVDCIIQPNPGFLGLFLDFEVEAGKTVTLSTLVAYEPDYLNLSYDEEGKLQAGTAKPAYIGGAPFVVQSAGERDVHRKQKGIDRGSSDVVSAELYYVIDQYTPDGELLVNIRDEFYGKEHPRTNAGWIANINPTDDKGTAPFAAPSALHSYVYPDDGGQYVLDFQHANPLTPFNANCVKQVPGELNYAFSDAMLAYFQRKGVQEYVELPDGVADGDYVGISMGEYGVKYEYHINIKNDGDSARKLRYELEMAGFNSSVYVVRDAQTGAVVPIDGNNSNQTALQKAERGKYTIFEIPIPAGAHYVITVTNLCGVDTTGHHNFLTIGH